MITEFNEYFVFRNLWDEAEETTDHRGHSTTERNQVAESPYFKLNLCWKNQETINERERRIEK